MTRPIPDCYEFCLVVAGIDLDDEAGLEALFTAFNGDISVAGTTTTDLTEVLVTNSGEHPTDVVESTIAMLHKVLPDVVVHRVDQELVSISDIAQNTGKTRETIRLYADGKRGAGGFPAPVGVVGDAIRVWRWTDVDSWLRQHAGFTFPTRPIPSWCIDVVNASLEPVDHLTPMRVGA